ncbi:hypothetical protein [Lacrimispora sp.]|uniref:hypothetical protein n=1 Tax=Lacrimispora sp. TaxID=2719234 RepID=UPI0034604864
MTEQIREYQNRPYGVSIKKWCDQHEITVANYYYRLREVSKACLEHILHNTGSQSIVQVLSELMHEDLRSVAASRLKVSVNSVGFNIKL